MNTDQCVETLPKDISTNSEQCEDILPKDVSTDAKQWKMSRSVSTNCEQCDNTATELDESSCSSHRATPQGHKIQCTDTNAVAIPAEENPPRNVSKAMWQKFQELQKRRLDVTRGSTAKRVKRMQNDIIDKVSRELGSSEEAVLLQPNTASLAKAEDDRVQSDSHGDQQVNVGDSRASGSKPHVDSRERWCNVKPYLGVNEHLKGLDRGKYAPKTKLEEKIDEAISLGDFQTAENLSDHLSTRDFGKKVADAFDAKKYAENKKNEEDRKSANRKKKLEWGFEHKHRWETKGNM